MAPARDIFPCLVKEDFKAPVPAYILDRASPLSAHKLECRIQKSDVARSSRCPRKASMAIWEIMVWTRFVLSRQSRQFVLKTPSCCNTTIGRGCDFSLCPEVTVASSASSDK